MPEAPGSPGHSPEPGAGPDPTEAALRRALEGRAASVDPGDAPRVSALGAQPRRWPAALAAAAGVAVLAVASTMVVPGVGPEPVAAPSSVATAVGTPSGAGSPDGPTAAPTAASSAEPTAEPTADPTALPPGTTGTAPASTPPAATDPVTAGAVAWFVREDRDGPGLVPERIAARAGGGTEARVAAAVNHLLSSPAADDDDFNGWWHTGREDPGRVRGVRVTDDGTTLDLPSAAFDGSIGSAYAGLSLAALARTAVSNGATPPVTVLVDGRADAEVWGVIALDRPLQPDTRSLAGGWLLDPYEGQRVPAGLLKVSGTGTSTGEDLRWEVSDGAGGVVADGRLRAGGAYTSFSFTVELGPGRYVVAVRDAGGGRPDEGPGPVWEHTTTITVVE